MKKPRKAKVVYWWVAIYNDEPDPYTARTHKNDVTVAAQRYIIEPERIARVRVEEA